MALAAALAALPVPVRAFVARRDSCDHWAGEEPYDAARARDIAHALREGRCDRIERDGAALRRRYAGRPDVRKAIDGT